MYVYTPVFPVYAGVLGASMSTVGLAVGAYGLTQMLLRIPLGIISDSIGKRRIFVVIGMLICGAAALGFAFAPTPFWLVIFRGVMGVSAATWVCSTVLFTSYFPKSHPSVPLSIMTFASAIGQVLAVSAGGEMAQRLGWIAPFWASLTLSIFAAAGAVPCTGGRDRQGHAHHQGRNDPHRQFLGACVACILGILCNTSPGRPSTVSRLSGGRPLFCHACPTRLPYHDRSDRL